MKKRLLSGIQPSGTMHIGNYFGAIKQFVDLQDQYESFVFVADFHAITTVQNKEILSKNTLEITMDYLACGLDPKKVCLFKQSDIPEVTELAWYFNCLTPIPYLMRANAFKARVDKNAIDNINLKDFSTYDEYVKTFTGINVGLFDYPMLMAADILIQDADIVPVGSDQKQHVEYARDTALKFNNAFGETFKLPEVLILKEVAIVPGTDGKKMSKSYGNTIPLFGTDEQIRKAVMGIITDSKAPSDIKNPDECNIFAIHKLFLKGDTLENLRKRYTDGGLGYKESKDMLCEEIISFIKPMREKREYFEKHIDEVKNILNEGGKKAKNNIKDKMQIIRDRVGVNL